MIKKKSDDNSVLSTQYAADRTGVLEDGWKIPILISYAYWCKSIENQLKKWEGKYRLYLDSGAFTAYIPQKSVIGVSKLARILEAFSRRLQIQERIAMQVADTIEKFLQSAGVAVCLEAQHFCMTARGVKKQNSIVVTSALRGIFKDKPDTRAEFYSIIKGN